MLLPASRGEVESWAARLARLSGKSTSGKWGLLASHFLGAGKKSVQLETYPPLTGSQFQAFCLGLYHLDSSESRLWNSVGHLNGPCLSIPGFPARRICSAEFGKGEWNYWNHLRVMVVEQVIDSCGLLHDWITVEMDPKWLTYWSRRFSLPSVNSI